MEEGTYELPRPTSAVANRYGIQYTWLHMPQEQYEWLDEHYGKVVNLTILTKNDKYTLEGVVISNLEVVTKQLLAPTPKYPIPNSIFDRRMVRLFLCDPAEARWI